MCLTLQYRPHFSYIALPLLHCSSFQGQNHHVSLLPQFPHILPQFRTLNHRVPLLLRVLQQFLQEKSLTSSLSLSLSLRFALHFFVSNGFVSFDRIASNQFDHKVRVVARVREFSELISVNKPQELQFRDFN